jgi:DNA-binding response OmpR family regulator
LSDSRALRVLVVEYDALLSVLLEDSLLHAGYDVVGPFPTGAAAHGSVLEHHVDVAVLDVLHGHDASFSLAAELEQQGIPFAFATGVQRGTIPIQHRHRPFLQKPFGVSDLLLTVSELAAGVP